MERAEQLLKHRGAVYGMSTGLGGPPGAAAYSAKGAN
jgi:hypothetical protein